MPNQVRLILSPIELKEGEMGRTRDGRVYVGLANKQFIEIAGQVTGRTVVQPVGSPGAAVRGGSGADFSGYTGVLRVANGQLLGNTTTDYLPEGASQYFTEARARAAVQPGAHLYGASAAGTDAYAVTLIPAITALTVGMTVRVKADVANTGPATLRVNGLPATPAAINKRHDRELATGDIEAGQIITVAWDGACWQLQSPPAEITAAETTADTAAFGGILTGDDDTVQKALDRLDDHTHGASGNGGNEYIAWTVSSHDVGNDRHFTASCSPTAASLAAGDKIFWTPNAAPIGGAGVNKFNPDGIGDILIYDGASSAPHWESGGNYLMVFDGTNFRLIRGGT